MKMVLADYKTAAIDEKLRATLGLLEKLTLTPDALSANDIRPVLAAGDNASAVRADGRLLLRVWDSGEGFPIQAGLPSGHGLHNLKGRLDALWGSNASVEFPPDEAGTTVQVSMPATVASR